MSSSPAIRAREAQAQAEVPLGPALGLLRRALWPDRAVSVWAAIWLLLAGLLEAAGPLLGKHFIDRYLLPRHFDAAMIALLLGGALALGVAASALRYLQLLRIAKVAMQAVQRLREWIFGHLLRLPMAYFDHALTGQLVSRVTNDTEKIRELYVQVLFEVLQGLTVLAGTIVAMAWLDLRLMAIVLTLVPAVALIVWAYQRWSAPAVLRTRELRSEINAQVAEAISGMNVLQASGSAGRFAARFAATNERYYRSRRGELRATAWLLRPALDLLNVLLIVAVVAAFGAQPVAAMEIGLLYAFIAYIARVVEPLIQITQQFSILHQALIAAGRVQALRAQNAVGALATPAKVQRGEISVASLSFGYDPAEPVLHDVSFSVPAGTFCGIVGPTGSGKSTLLALLLRFYVPQSGRIEIDGLPLTAIDERQFREAIGLVPQDPFLLATSVYENIDLGRGLDPAAIEAAARAARADRFIAALPRGYDTLLGEGGAGLSSGQKQLLALARALAGSPRVLLLDEATARIDSETERAVAEALETLRGRSTVIAIAHRLSTIRAADRILVLNHGRLVESGRHEELLAREGGIYQRLYLLQQLGQ